MGRGSAETFLGCCFLTHWCPRGLLKEECCSLEKEISRLQVSKASAPMWNETPPTQIYVDVGDKLYTLGSFSLVHTSCLWNPSIQGNQLV